MGQPSDIGEDRAMTNMILKQGKHVLFQKNAVAYTNVPEEYLENYLQEVDEEHYLVNESLRKRICFNRVNLINFNNNTIGKMEIIICQNVLIYFKRETRLLILNHLVEHLVPGGLLILGAGEITGWKHPELNTIKYDGVLAFQRNHTQLDTIEKPRYDA